MAKFSELDRNLQVSLFFVHECFKIACLMMGEMSNEKDTEIAQSIAHLCHHSLSNFTSEEFESILSRFIHEYDNLDSRPQGINVIEIRFPTPSQN